MSCPLPSNRRPAVEFNAPTAADVAELLADLRPADAAEVWALGFDDPAVGLRICLEGAAWSRAARCRGGRLLAIFGVSPMGSLIDPRGAPWLLGTPEMTRRRRIVAEQAGPYIAAMLRDYPHLINHVHAANTVAVGWLRRMGFTLHPAAPLPPHGEPFHLFEKRA